MLDRCGARHSRTDDGPDVLDRCGARHARTDDGPDVLDRYGARRAALTTGLRPDVLDRRGAVRREHRRHTEQVHHPLRVDWLGQTCDCASFDRLIHQLR